MSKTQPLPDARGRFGPYGGRYVPELLMSPLDELTRAYDAARKDKAFVVQRRGGGHGPTVIPNPEDWSTPRSHYANTCMLAPLPAPPRGLFEAP